MGSQSLTTVTFPTNPNSDSLTSIYSMFGYCHDLTTINNLYQLKINNVTNMSCLFNGCVSLTSVNLSGWNTSNVTNMSTMFNGCSSLTSVNLAGWNTSKVAKMNEMFCRCSALTSVGDFAGWNTSNVTAMWDMFAYCSALTSLNLSGWNTSNVTNMSDMFRNCSKLQAITFGKNWKWIGTNGYLPTPNSQSIPGADGKWYSTSTEKAYAPNGIPSNCAGTYVANKTLLTDAILVPRRIANMVVMPLTIKNIPYKNYTGTYTCYIYNANTKETKVLSSNNFQSDKDSVNFKIEMSIGDYMFYTSPNNQIYMNIKLHDNISNNELNFTTKKFTFTGEDKEPNEYGEPVFYLSRFIIKRNGVEIK